jgi:hypothetical protein
MMDASPRLFGAVSVVLGSDDPFVPHPVFVRLLVRIFVLLSSTSSPSRVPLLLWVRRATSVDAETM